MCFDFEQRVHDALACMEGRSLELMEESVDIIDLGVGVTIPGLEAFRLKKLPAMEKIPYGFYRSTIPNHDFTIEVIDQLPDGTVVFNTSHGEDDMVTDQMQLHFFKDAFVRAT